MRPEDLAEEIGRAAARLAPHVRETPLEPSPVLGEPHGARVYLKLENLQHTGSFKVRGAMHKLLTLTAEQRERGVVAASTGNHGIATAFAMERLGVPGRIFVTRGAAASKVRAIERSGVEVRRVGEDCVETETHARRFAAERNLVYVSPYNDPAVVAGQGTVAVELTRRLGSIDAVLVALGGGGLAAGIAAHLAEERPEARVVGCSPERSCVMVESVRAGRILDLPSSPTLSDATAGGVEADAITFPLCRELVTEYVTVSEEEIARSLRTFLDAHHLLIEGAAAVPLAAWTRLGPRLAGQTVVIVLCGANIDLPVLRKVLTEAGD